MSTVVRSLAAKVEVQTREAEANLDRFRRKLRTSAPISGVALGANLHGGGLQFRGDGGFQSVMSDLSGGGMAGLGTATAGGGESVGALAGLGGIKGFNALLKGGGAVVIARQLEKTFGGIADAVDRLQDGTATWTETLGDGLRSLPLLGDFTRGFDELFRIFGRGDDIRALNEQAAGVDALTRDLAFRADEKIKRKEVAAGVGETFRMDIEAAEAESLAERAEQTQRFADMQQIASSAAERYNARVNELRMGLMAGAISQDAFNESMKAANETYDEQSGVLDTIREQQQEIRDYWEDRRRTEREAAALSKQTAMEEEDRLRRERRMEGVAIDASRIFVGRGASGVSKQAVEDPQLKVTNTLLRTIANNIGTARAA